MSTAAQPGPPRTLQAVLIDMDGTIVDTEPYWTAAEYSLVQAHGGSWNDSHAEALVGNALLTSADYIRRHGGVQLDSPTIVQRLLDEVISAARQAIRWRPGAVALLAELNSAGIPCALVTMSYTRLAEVVAAHLPAGTFTTLVTGDQVRDGKPHPEAYLTAAARLGVDPHRCVAIEDSMTGITSAQAAGCVVVAVPHVVPIEPHPRRSVVSSLTELSVEILDAMVVRAADARTDTPGPTGPRTEAAPGVAPASPLPRRHR